MNRDLAEQSAEMADAYQVIQLLRSAGLSKQMVAMLLRQPERADGVVAAIQAELAKDVPVVVTGREKLSAVVLATPIEEFILDSRSYHLLKRQSIDTLAELILMSERRLLLLRQFGPTMLDHVKGALGAYNVSLLPEGTNPRDAAVRLYGSVAKMHPRHLLLWHSDMAWGAERYVKQAPSLQSITRQTFDDLVFSSYVIPGGGKRDMTPELAKDVETALELLGLSLRTSDSQPETDAN